MRAVQGIFTSLEDLMMYEERGELKLGLLSIVRSFNVRARIVQIYQISSTYMPHLERKTNHFLGHRTE